MSKETSNYVSRDKYENIKQKGTQWYNECSELKYKVEQLTKMNKELIKQNEDLLDSVTNTEAVDELENENKSLRKEIRNLKKDFKIYEDKHRDKIVQLERDLFVKDGKVQRLEDTKKDLNERYIELKEDWRDERRSNKKEK